MKKLNNFRELDNAKYRQMGADIEEALKLVGEKWGVSFKTKNASNTLMLMTIKLEAAIANADGVPVIVKEVEDWNRQCHMYGFKKEDLGRTFTHNGELLQILGLLPSRPKYPILCKRVDGGPNAKNIILTEDAAKRALYPETKPAGGLTKVNF